MMKNNWKKISFFYLVAFILIFFWVIPPFSQIWEKLDYFSFRFLNESLRENEIWRNFWAMMNWEGERLISFLVLFLVYFWYLYTIPKHQRTFKIFHLIGFFGFACLALLLSRIIMHNWLHLRRASPSLVFLDCVRLSHYFPSLAIKDCSKASFPGDHTTALFLWASYLLFYAAKKFKYIAIGLVIFLSLPRLFAGAHWLSDDIVGSGSLALIILAWALYSSVAHKIAQFLNDFLKENGKWKKFKLTTKNF